MAAVKSEETELTAKTAQSDVSASAITVLFGKDHKVESTDTTDLDQWCRDKCPPLHIDPMDWWKTNKNKLAK